ncbi:chromosome partitioning protein [Actinophytocola sp. NPDC049390]|uniref:chromosome partitioning protein n=1 Tax=Actinophytocola sp. NPDC049390 TaxID=3363894 RepID=UPI0037911BB0
MVIAIGSVKGSPGVTTLAVALGACWPAPGHPVIVECDPSGGSLAARFGLRTAPGLVSLTAAARQDPDLALLWAHTQPLPGGLPVVVAPPGGDYTRAALATLLDARRQAVPVLRGATARPGAVVIADCGRLDAGSPGVTIAREADRLLLLARPRPDELSHLAAALSMVDLWAMHPSLVLAGTGYPPAEVTRALGVQVLATIPDDESGAAALTGMPGRRRDPARSGLGRAAHSLANALLETARPRDHAELIERPAAPGSLQHNHPWPQGRQLPPRNGAKLEDRR